MNENYFPAFLEFADFTFQIVSRSLVKTCSPEITNCLRKFNRQMLKLSCFRSNKMLGKIYFSGISGFTSSYRYQRKCLTDTNL